jgi:hypothetical protein
MPNWCANYTTFKGSKENIEALNNAINKAIERETAEKSAQTIHSSEVKEDHFFDIFNNGIEHEELTIFYETRWCPNLDDLAVLCKEFRVDAETEFNESGEQIYGTAKLYSDGTYLTEFVEQEFLDLIEYDICTDLYTYNGEDYGVFEEIIEDHYSTWKNNNL